jgi:hypothetical protein
MKILASIFLAIWAMLFSGCVSREKEKLQELAQLAQTASCNVKIEFDNPEVILDAALDKKVISGFGSKGKFETQDEYQQRIAASKAATNLEGKTFTILIPVNLIQYKQHWENPARWFVVTKDKGPCFTVAEKRVLENTVNQKYYWRNELDQQMSDERVERYYSIQVLELSPLNTLLNTGIGWQFEFASAHVFGPNISPPRLGLLIDRNDAAFRQKMRNNNISLAIGFAVKNIQSSSYSHKEYSDRDHYKKETFRLPVYITDVWCVDTTDNHAFAHWSSSE